MIERTVDEMYRTDTENEFLEVTYQNGDKETMYFKDFASGAMIENIVRRAKKLAIKRVLADGPKGICLADMVESIHQEYKEHEDLPNTTNPDDWAKISGKKGERIGLRAHHRQPRGRRRRRRSAIERVATGRTCEAAEVRQVRLRGLTDTARDASLSSPWWAAPPCSRLRRATWPWRGRRTRPCAGRSILRRPSAVSDDALADYPGTADAIEEMAVGPWPASPLSGVGPPSAARSSAVQSGWGWQACIEAELRATPPCSPTCARSLADGGCPVRRPVRRRYCPGRVGSNRGAAQDHRCRDRVRHHRACAASPTPSPPRRS